MPLDKRFEESKLLFDLSHGSELAFTKLYNQYKNLVYSTALKITKSKTLAEEVVQDVFLKIWQNKENVTEIENFENYIFITSRNYIFDMIKKIARENRWTSEIKQDDLSFSLTDSSLKDEQYNTILNQIIDLLPPQQQKIYKMAKIDGMSYQKIGEILSISPLTVKKHMSQALKFIRIQVSKYINLVITGLICYSSLK